jgi:hypothetical protein
MAKTIKGHGKGVIFKKGVKSLKQWKMKKRNLGEEFEDFRLNV